MFGFGKKKRKKEQEQALLNKKEEKVNVEPVGQKDVVGSDEKQQETKPSERKMVYHVTKHKQGGWQIKKGKAEKALKRFKTQAEAITYGKQLEQKGHSFIIHKADGKTRKKKY